MQQVDDDGQQGGLLAAVLGRRGGEGPADLPLEGAPRPDLAGLVQEAAHLRRHPPEPGADADDDRVVAFEVGQDRKSTRLNSSHANISYAVFCLKKKNT